MQYCLLKNIKILPSATKYMDLECIILSEMRQINTACCILYVKSKSKTSECNKTEADSQMQRINEWLPRIWQEEDLGEGQDRNRGLKSTNYYV